MRLRLPFPRRREDLTRTAFVRRDDGTWSRHEHAMSVYVDVESNHLVVEAVDGSALAIYRGESWMHVEHPLGNAIPAGARRPSVQFWEDFPA